VTTLSALSNADAEEATMGTCDVCGNDYDKSFDVTSARGTHTFGSFECAIHLMAPTCAHCGCKVIGHGVEVDGRVFCCAHCARRASGAAAAVADRA
jgi:hypothetical protein